jgi:hypothetical protein
MAGTTSRSPPAARPNDSHAGDAISSAAASAAHRTSPNTCIARRYASTALAEAATTDGNRAATLSGSPIVRRIAPGYTASGCSHRSPSSCTSSGLNRPLASGCPAAIAATRAAIGRSRAVQSSGIVAVSSTTATALIAAGTQNGRGAASITAHSNRK